MFAENDEEIADPLAVGLREVVPPNDCVVLCPEESAGADNPVAGEKEELFSDVPEDNRDEMGPDEGATNVVDWELGTLGDNALDDKTVDTLEKLLSKLDTLAADDVIETEPTEDLRMTELEDCESMKALLATDTEFEEIELGIIAAVLLDADRVSFDAEG